MLARNLCTSESWPSASRLRLKNKKAQIIIRQNLIFFVNLLNITKKNNQLTIKGHEKDKLKKKWMIYYYFTYYWSPKFQKIVFLFIGLIFSIFIGWITLSTVNIFQPIGLI